MADRFTLGVNYWPRRKAMYWWSDFDAGEMREEFFIIRDLGLSLVRFFLLWDDFQPAADMVSPTCMRNLVAACDIASMIGLKVDLTFFTGHMSGPNWSPRWLLGGNDPVPGNRQVISRGLAVSGGYRNPYTDPVALRAERLQVTTVASALKGHPAIGLWNLGNEPDLFAWPPDDAAGQAWVREMTGLIHRQDPGRKVTCGLHTANLLENNHLRVDQVFAETDVAVMHAYPMYHSDWTRGPLDPDFVPFTCALVSALCGKPTLMEEFGGCTAQPGEASYTWEFEGFGRHVKQFMANEDEFAEYVAAVLPRLLDVGATGAVIWCYADYVPALWTKPPCSESRHERFFGLVRPDGSLKPHAEVLRRFAAGNPAVRPPKRTLTLPFTPDEYYKDPRANAALLYRQWTAAQ